MLYDFLHVTHFNTIDMLDLSRLYLLSWLISFCWTSLTSYYYMPTSPLYDT